MTKAPTAAAEQCTVRATSTNSSHVRRASRKRRSVSRSWSVPIGRNDMTLVAEDRPGEFNVFFRRSEDFPENFSIGLSYDQKDGAARPFSCVVTGRTGCSMPHSIQLIPLGISHPPSNGECDQRWSQSRAPRRNHHGVRFVRGGGPAFRQVDKLGCFCDNEVLPGQNRSAYAGV